MGADHVGLAGADQTAERRPIVGKGLTDADDLVDQAFRAEGREKLYIGTVMGERNKAATTGDEAIG